MKVEKALTHCNSAVCQSPFLESQLTMVNNEPVGCNLTLSDAIVLMLSFFNDVFHKQLEKLKFGGKIHQNFESNYKFKSQFHHDSSLKFYLRRKSIKLLEPTKLSIIVLF